MSFLWLLRCANLYVCDALSSLRGKTHLSYSAKHITIAATEQTKEIYPVWLCFIISLQKLCRMNVCGLRWQSTWHWCIKRHWNIPTLKGCRWKIFVFQWPMASYSNMAQPVSFQNLFFHYISSNAHRKYFIYWVRAVFYVIIWKQSLIVQAHVARTWIWISLNQMIVRASASPDSVWQSRYATES